VAWAAYRVLRHERINLSIVERTAFCAARLFEADRAYWMPVEEACLSCMRYQKRLCQEMRRSYNFETFRENRFHCVLEPDSHCLQPESQHKLSFIGLPIRAMARLPLPPFHCIVSMCGKIGRIQAGRRQEELEEYRNSCIYWSVG
jgi:hypothetical protein